MKNGSYGTPLAGEYFKKKWSIEVFEPYTITLELPGNEFKAGNTSLKATGEGLDKMELK